MNLRENKHFTTAVLHLYNTLSRSKEAFQPLTPGKVGLYVCGPTVYDFFHVGNARTFSVFDLVVRWLRATGYEVKYVQNITDVDDKIIKRANESGEDIGTLTERLVEAFVHDSARLGLLRPDAQPRATRYIGPMLDLIERLEGKKLAYRGSNGDVFYSVRDFAEYGKLSRRNLDDLRAGERVAVEEAKKDPLDFVLWKAAKPAEPSWPSAYGPGRPGWHIECSAMAMKYLGDTLDIHTGGVDLTFPHHENEIAQAEGISGKQFVRFWLHAEHLSIDAQKMSKSLGNFYTLRDLLKQGFAPEAIRYLLASVPYRKKLNFTFEGLQAAAHSIDRLRNYELRLKTDKFAEGSNPAMEERTHKAIAAFEEALDDDLNTAEALGAVFEYIRDTNTAMDAGDFLAGNAAGALAFLARFDAVFDVLKPSAKEGGLSDEEVETLIAERTSAKKARNFSRADEIRAELSAKGIVIEDTKEGVRWKRA